MALRALADNITFANPDRFGEPAIRLILEIYSEIECSARNRYSLIMQSQLTGLNLLARNELHGKN